ncbi:MAG: hypothetical protein H7Z19_06985 [Chitinophagaceae bacterium]|nr:hypothetical protein [Rubrivivax sp.]
MIAMRMTSPSWKVQYRRSVEAGQAHHWASAPGTLAGLEMRPEGTEAPQAGPHVTPSSASTQPGRRLEAIYFA